MNFTERYLLNKTVCIIPARGGSKRIPGKNIRNFLGKPIVKYPIEAAKASGIFDDIIVYTDCLKIAAEVLDYNDSQIKVVSSRPTVSDDQTLAESILEFLQITPSLPDYDIICVMLPTAVFIEKKALHDSKFLLQNTDIQSICSVMYEKDFIKWGRDVKGRLWFDMPFRDAGQFYFIKKDIFIKQKSLIAENCYIWEHSCIDINIEEDWSNAENLYKSTRLLEG